MAVPLDPLTVHLPAVHPQQRRDPAIGTAAEAGGQPHDRGSQRRLVVRDDVTVPLGESRLAQHPARPTL